MKDDHRKFAPVGRCIYCGKEASATNALTDEHMIALSLGGTVILQEASCDACAKVTTKFDEYCGRVMFQEVRSALRIRSRKPKKRPAHFQLTVNFPDRSVKLDLPVDEFPAAFILPVFGLPGILQGRPPGGNWPGGHFSQVHREIAHEAITHRCGPGWIDWVYNKRIELGPLARMLAKVAHCMCVAKLGYGSFKEFLPSLILHKDPNLATYLVGSDPKILPAPNHNRHEIKLLQCRMGGRILLCVTIRLFGCYQTPTYLVVAGESPTTLPYIDGSIPETF